MKLNSLNLPVLMKGTSLVETPYRLVHNTHTNNVIILDELLEYIEDIQMFLLYMSFISQVK